MQIANFIGLGVAAFMALTTATTVNPFGDEEIVRALAARDLSIDELKAIINLMPRQDAVPTVTVYPATCPPSGTSSVIESTGTSSAVVVSTSIATDTTITPLTPTETPTVPVPATPATPTVATPEVPPVSTPVETSVPAPSIPATLPSTTKSSTEVVITSSSATITSSVSASTAITFTSTHTPVTQSTSTGIPPAPSNGASTAGVNIGVLGLAAVLALA